MTQPNPAAPPAPTGGDPNPPAPTSQPPAAPPVPTPPVNPPAPQPTPPTPSGQQGDGKTFTQADLDRIINERLEKAQKSWQAQQTDQMKKLAEVFGWQDPNATPDPAKMLEQAQQQATAHQQRADLADAKALALAAGVKPERVDLFLRVVDVAGALKDVDRSQGDSVTAALKSAVDGALTAAPEFKGAPALPGSSGGDRLAPNGKRQWTRAEIEGMSQKDLLANHDEIAAAMAEGRVTF
ncbi:DUF4355 domain-containing protein [Lentzea sp. NBRC 105346]|uniref:capsid assembly scaffolding protein Gp46 family protein n=1 Tax=Lentzea sp. NBRC 105346 TaxID=3032205 RepID=UPI0025545857|nr:DUF4355 domain-containing protein [Lentzea sp. NBRC 105346]